MPQTNFDKIKPDKTSPNQFNSAQAMLNLTKLVPTTQFGDLQNWEAKQPQNSQKSQFLLPPAIKKPNCCQQSKAVTLGLKAFSVSKHGLCFPQLSWKTRTTGNKCDIFQPFIIPLIPQKGW